jgi:cell division protein ZapE
MGVARFSFEELCGRPLGSLDYLHLAHSFHTLLLDDIPVLGRERREVARRFMNLIDTLYDNRVCLVASAAAEPGALFSAPDVAGIASERTVSRLLEMRSRHYLAGREQRLSARVPA